MTKGTDFPVKSPIKKKTKDFIVNSVTNVTNVTSGELPDCPACGRNEWEAGKENYICPCGNTMPMDGDK